MTKTQSATEITATAKSLPTLPVVTAKSMLYAQGYTPTRQERAAILARADFFETVGMSREVNIKVVDFSGSHIGHLGFNI